MNNKCKDCDRPMTWAEQKTQYRRLIKRGYTHEIIATILPRCSKCLTRWLKDHPNSQVARVAGVATYPS